MSLTLYRKSCLGTTLSTTLQEFKLNKKISDTIESKFLEYFDTIICEELQSLNNKGTIKGIVTSFKNCDDIWIFYGKNIKIKNDNKNSYDEYEKLKIVACDKNMKSSISQKKYNNIYNNVEENN